MIDRLRKKLAIFHDSIHYEAYSLWGVDESSVFEIRPSPCLSVVGRGSVWISHLWCLRKLWERAGGFHLYNQTAWLACAAGYLLLPPHCALPPVRGDSSFLLHRHDMQVMKNMSHIQSCSSSIVLAATFSSLPSLMTRFGYYIGWLVGTDWRKWI